ncbi:MAG TPA: ABC transporter substrate-binding protein, partial [Gammaproteobacteria bacterium]|nr:ABC transporter substrate-binding protein [Gammaproteobacteria bacterium]
LPDDVVDALRIASKQVIQETIAEDETAKKVYESFQSFRADVMPYTAISEAAFLEIRGDD